MRAFKAYCACLGFCLAGRGGSIYAERKQMVFCPQITAAQGAQEAVHYVGGLLAILTAAGLDLSSAKVAEDVYLRDCPDPSSVSEIQLELRKYEDVKARLANRKRLGIELIDRDGPIPDATLASVRYSFYSARVDTQAANTLYHLNRFESVPSTAQ